MALSQTDRRRQQRISVLVHAEIAPWLGDRAGTSFGVLLESISTAGVGIVHSGRLRIGGRYLLEIPRPNQRALSTLFTAVRCDETDGGLFNVQLEPDSVLD